MWWGYSPPLDIQSEVNGKGVEHLEVLIAGAGDARHIIKTLASSYTHPERTVTYHVIEPTLEQVARTILLLNITLEKDLGLQEATRYFLEILGNTLLRPATGKYLATVSNRLTDVPSESIDCPWLSLEKFKYKDRDHLEWIFKFWTRATLEGVPIVNYWDRRIRKSLKTRYDYRDGVFDWDYHMVLKSRNIEGLTVQEYKFWRNNGVAFTWLEGEPTKSNPTLLSNISQHGNGFLHYAYLGDITNGPFFTWALNEMKNNQKRATDIAEREVMRAIYEIKAKEPLCTELVAAHRDPSILNGTIITEIPDNEMELESWIMNKKSKLHKDTLLWADIPNQKIVFHPIESMQLLQTKQEYISKFDVIWVAHNMTKQVPHFVSLLKNGAPMLLESRKYLAELRKEDLEAVTKDLKNMMHQSGLHGAYDFNSEKHVVARFYKN